MPNIYQQLKNWSHQGNISKSKKTYELIKNSLKKCNDKYCGGKLDYEIYLSGSYKNSTNTEDSDLDVIVQLNSIYLSNTSFHQNESAINKAYDIWKGFKDCMLSTVESTFIFENITLGNKSIKIETEDNLTPIDVVPCLEYRNYFDDSVNYKSGITFWHASGGYQIIHYPKRHYHNGVEKQKLTNSNYKSTVRIFKNMRALLGNENPERKKESTSYFIECLLYNVPNEIYTQPVDKIISQVLDYFDNSKIDAFFQQHNDRSFRLFGTHPEQWNVEYARDTLNDIKYLYKNI